MDEHLAVAEIPQQHVGRGRALVDPAVLRKNGWSSGQIIELVHNRKSHVKAWPAPAADDGAGLVRVDGVTRRNVGAGIGDRITVRAVDASHAEKVVLSPTEKIESEGLHEYMAGNYTNHVFTVGDTVSLSTRMGGRVQFVVTATRPTGPVIVSEQTRFEAGPMTKAVDASAPRVTYDDLGGLRGEVRKMREMVELPMRHPELFERIGVEAPKGVLLYGPPGTGKTLLARAVAGETDARFFSLSGPEIMGKYHGESEERIREVFERAGSEAPSVVFIDEIDSIAPKRDEVSGEVEKRVVSQLLTLMDGIRSRGKVVVIAATNRPDSIDPALRRPGRFDREIEMGMPDEAGRREILAIHTRGMPVDESADLDKAARASHGFVGADLEYLAKEAAMRSLRRTLPEIDLDGIRSRGKVVVIAATNRPDSIDPALRRPGRFDREIEMGMPDEAGRREILAIHTRGMPVDESADLDKAARASHGFVGADLEYLAKEAAMRSLRRTLPEIDLDGGRIGPDVLEKIRITADDLSGALREIRPSALREVLVQVPDVSWDDIGGLDSLKEELREAIEWPLLHREAFERAGASAPSGILLHGPPGTGKTLIAKAVARMTDSNFISVKGPELFSKWVGESEKGVREIFRKARQAAPCVIFFDEIDSLAPKRSGSDCSRASENVVSQMLTEMDGLEELQGVVVVGATNRPDMLDPALLRPGRFDRIVEVPLPDAKSRERILSIHMRSKPLVAGADLAALARRADGLSGAQLESVADRAALAALRRHVAASSDNPDEIRITQDDLDGALALVSGRASAHAQA